MSTRKILSFGGEHPETFFRFLQYFAAKKSWSWTFEHHAEYKPELLQGAQAGYISSGHSSQVLPHLKVLPAQVRALELMDSMFMEQSSWYPRILLDEVLRRVFVSDARDLDIRSSAFVVGEGECARVVAMALAEIGLKDIYLVGDVPRLQQQKKIISRSQLGIHFHILAPEELTMQSTSASIVVNTVNLKEQKTLLTDLSYFNFMARAGFALDLSNPLDENLLMEEAERADLRVLRYSLVARSLTQLWTERLEPSEKISDAEAIQLWKDFLQENPPSV